MKSYGPTERQVEIPWMVDHLGKPERILDIGSAGGMYFDDLKATGAEIWLCDTHPFPAPDGVSIFIESAANLPYELDSYFDLVTCISTLDHVGLEAYGNQEDKSLLPRTCLEIARVTATDGRLLLTVPYGRDLWTSHPGGGQRVFSWNSLLDLFPDSMWIWGDVIVWKLRGDEYVETKPWLAANAGYARDRAAACIALDLMKKEVA